MDPYRYQPMESFARGWNAKSFITNLLFCRRKKCLVRTPLYENFLWLLSAIHGHHFGGKIRNGGPVPKLYGFLPWKWVKHKTLNWKHNSAQIEHQSWTPFSRKNLKWESIVSLPTYSPLHKLLFTSLEEVNTKRKIGSTFQHKSSTIYWYYFRPKILNGAVKCTSRLLSLVPLLGHSHIFLTFWPLIGVIRHAFKSVVHGHYKWSFISTLSIIVTMYTQRRH